MLYYAMELLDGMNVEHFVYRFGPIEPRRAVHWLRQACHSLGEAHARDLVHRDIKPANLFVCRYGRDVDFIKILDFGLTRPPRSAEQTATTRPGAVMGTAGYMAPEQVFGLRGRSPHRSLRARAASDTGCSRESAVRDPRAPASCCASTRRPRRRRSRSVPGSRCRRGSRR